MTRHTRPHPSPYPHLEPNPDPEPNSNHEPHPNQAGACKAALSVPHSEGGKGGKGLEEDLDASKSGEAFDPRTLDLKVGDTSC